LNQDPEPASQVKPDPIRIQGFDHQKLKKKKIQFKIFFIFSGFLFQFQFPFVQATGGAFSSQKRTSSSSKKEIY
jgi:hypothetical protein